MMTEVTAKSGEQKDASCLTKKGDEFFKEKKYEEALTCYNEAIEQDKTNLDLLLSRVLVYHYLKKYSESIEVGEELLNLSTNDKRRYKSTPVFKTLFWIARSYSLTANWEIAKKYYERALQIGPPDQLMETTIHNFNFLRKGGSYMSDPEVALKTGIMFNYCGDMIKAIENFTNAISLNKSSPLAYACRAACYADDSKHEKDLVSDVKECIDLDYRFQTFFQNKAEELKLLGQIDASFRIYKALSSSAETYRLSAGKFFPKLIDSKPLNKSEKKRFQNLNESWHEKYSSSLEKLSKISDFKTKSQSVSKPDTNIIETTENSGARTVVNEHALCMKEKGDKFYKDEKFEEALECYNKAIELDESTNLELLSCRVNVYFSMEKYRECIAEGRRLVSLCPNNERFKSLEVFKALKLVASSHALSKKTDSAAKETYIEAMRITVPAAEIELLIRDYNNLLARCGYIFGVNRLPSDAAMETGILLYSHGDKSGANLKFDEAIRYDSSNLLAQVCRLVSYAEYRDHDLKKTLDHCIHLDYRCFDYFINKADEFRLDGRMAASSQLYVALSSMEDKYESSVAKFFPKLLYGRKLNKSERKHFKDLEESWREKYLPTLERLKMNSESDSE